MSRKLKNMFLIVLAGIMMMSLSNPILGNAGDKSADSDRYTYSGPNYYGYTADKQYRPHQRDWDEDRYDRYDHRDHRRITKEIRKNERRIEKLERKLAKLYRKRYNQRKYDRHSRHDYYSIRIRELKWEISQLHRRNRYLRSLLHHH